MKQFKTNILNRKIYKQNPVMIEGDITHELTDNLNHEKESRKENIPSEIDLNIKGPTFFPNSSYKTLKQIGEDYGYPKFGKMLKKYYCKFLYKNIIFLFTFILNGSITYFF